jgi:hypothetical protein
MPWCTSASGSWVSIGRHPRFECSRVHMAEWPWWGPGSCSFAEASRCGLCCWTGPRFAYVWYRCVFLANACLLAIRSVLMNRCCRIVTSAWESSLCNSAWTPQMAGMLGLSMVKCAESPTPSWIKPQSVSAESSVFCLSPLAKALLSTLAPKLTQSDKTSKRKTSDFRPHDTRFLSFSAN